MPAVKYHYPADLAQYLSCNWPASEARPVLPDLPVLTQLLATCYQASMLTEELQPVTFRLALLEPEQIPPLDGPPRGHHRLTLQQARPLVANTLRKLSPAVEYSHSLLGVRCRDEQLEIWGMVHSGPRGTNSFYSSGRGFCPLPLCLLISIKGPGAVSVSNGSRVIAKLSRGRISVPGDEVLNSRWIRSFFGSARKEMEAVYERVHGRPPTVSLDPSISQHLMQSIWRRSLQLLRRRGHGATLLVAPPELAASLLQENPYLAVRYPLQEEEPRRRCRTLLVRLVHRLGQLFPAGTRVDWTDYLASEDIEVAEIDAAMEEFAELLANLAAVDGAVLLTPRLELLGFGGEIAGNLPTVESIEVALDIEGQATRTESTDTLGARHRFAFRICAQLRDMLAVVLSQDGRVQLIKCVQDRVLSWDQLSTGAGDF